LIKQAGAVANGLQDQFKVTSASATPFEMPNYGEVSFTGTPARAKKGTRGSASSGGRKHRTDRPIV